MADPRKCFFRSGPHSVTDTVCQAIWRASALPASCLIWIITSLPPTPPGYLWGGHGRVPQKQSSGRDGVESCSIRP